MIVLIASFLFFSFIYIESKSELLAHIHQVKLYFHYILADEFATAGVPTPAKLDARCVRLSFDEMRQEGFADDGLFDQMKDFFLPLTMVEQDLSIDERRWRSIERAQSRQRQQLLDRKKRLSIELEEKEDEYYRHDDSMKNLRRDISHRNQHLELENEAQYEKFSIRELMETHRNEMAQLERERNDLRAKIQSIDDLVNNIEQYSAKSVINNSKKIDHDLIKTKSRIYHVWTSR